MTSATLNDRLAGVRETLARYGQDHVLRFFDELNDSAKGELLGQIEAIDWAEIAGLIDSHVKKAPHVGLPDKLEPAPWYPCQPSGELVDRYAKARAEGERLIREGKVAAFTVAGGQGTRLGWDGPKGTYPATPIRGLSLFGCFAEYLRKIEQKYGHPCPWYIMTSPVNDEATRAFFEEQAYLGLDPNNVMFFPQAMMPAIDRATGKVLLESRSSLALSPNGHGGSLKALHDSGAIADMKRRGVEQISYTQVDNPSVKVIDPLFIGLHSLDRCEMSSKMLPKVHPKEKLGNFCQADGRVTVIEYSDLPDELAEARDEKGGLRFRAGSIAIHMIGVDFVESLNSGSESGGGFGLPFHRAEKKVACLDPASGEPIAPDEPNAVKLETFVFDALPLCERSIVYETDRVEEFAPIKNAEGEDSAVTSRSLQSERAARWLGAAGVTVARNADSTVDAVIEISQLTALEPGDLAGQKLPQKIEAGAEVLL